MGAAFAESRKGVMTPAPRKFQGMRVMTLWGGGISVGSLLDTLGMGIQPFRDSVCIH